MAATVRPVEAGPTAMEDPWDWGVEQVVAAICRRQTVLLSPEDFPKECPPPHLFEEIVRDNSIGGLALLKDVDNRSMREDLGIAKFGHRSAISHLIYLLRWKSPKYLDYIQMGTAESRLSSFSNAGQEHRSGSHYSNLPLANIHGLTTHGSILPQTPLTQTLRTKDWVQGQNGDNINQRSISRSPSKIFAEKSMLPPIPPSAIPSPVHSPEKYLESGHEAHGHNIDNTAHQPFVSDIAGLDHTKCREGETLVVNDRGQKRRKLVLGPLQPLTPPSELEPLCTLDQTSSPLSKQRSRSHVNDGLITSDVSHRSVSADRSEPTLSKSPEPATEATKNGANAEAGVLTLDKTGRKRMKPILISPPVEAHDSETKQAATSNFNIESGNAAQAQELRNMPLDPLDFDKGHGRRRRLAKHTYCGIRAIPVDTIFYGNTPLGQPIDHELGMPIATPNTTASGSEDFVLCNEDTYGNGQRLYANERLKHFLHKTSLRTLKREGKTAYALIPYPDRLAKKHQLLSLTKFTPSPEGYTTLRSKRPSAVVTGLSSPDQAGETQLFDVPELMVDQENITAEHPDWLEKWKYQDGNDEVLPLFGDSGSEGEYDLETWHEMEHEQGKLARPPPSYSRSPRLGNEDVQKAIDRATEKILEEWRSKKRPKLQQKAWKIWTKSTKEDSKRKQVCRLTAFVKSLDARLANLTKEILKEVWRSADQIMKQCKILQPSLFDKEESKWTITVLRLKRPPEKPQQSQVPEPKKLKVQTQPLLDNEEAISSDDERASGSSGNDLNDFVVNDDDVVHGASDDDVAMADAEDEDDFPDTNGIPSLVRPTLKDSSSRSPKPASRDLPPLSQAKSSLKPRVKFSPKLKPVFIDLTQNSDSTGIEEGKAKVSSSGGIRTPPLNAQESSDDSRRSSNKKRTGFKRPPVPTELIDLESESARTAEEDWKYHDQFPLPDLTDFIKISRLSPRLLEERQDRKRLLILFVKRSPTGRRRRAFNHIKDLSAHDVKLQVWEAFSAYKDETLRIQNCDSEISESFMLVAAWFVCWTIPVRLDPAGGINRDHIEIASTDEEGFEPFYDFLISCLKQLEASSEKELVKQDSPSSQEFKQRTIELLDDSDAGVYATPTKRRKHKVEESQEAQQLRLDTRKRVQEREQRAKAFSSRLQQMGRNEEDPTTVVVNPGKSEDQVFIYLNEKIGERIQPHQKDGVQFMWRELTGDHENLQGCLLAHTMGLGKTMQVITVLVTIAEAAQSLNENIRNQVPKVLHKSQTMVLCPPSLVENWYEEFLTWAPNPIDDNVGKIRCITSAISLPQRVLSIKAWSNESGILLLGFTIFRDLIYNRGNQLNDADHRLVKRGLLEKPTLVVADEAHTAKNLNSQLNKVMKQVKAKSRIALTGSPLANNIEEYYALIDWITPNYLGDHIEFKANYAEPIQRGTYKNCSQADYIESHKILKALQSDLELKVHRADLSVLKGKLKEKTEFLIKMPLTDLQMKLYTGYVDWMLGVARAEEPETAVLWAWLGELRLLCNHPSCFADRLQEKLSMRQASSTAQQKPAKPNKKLKASVDETDLATSEDEQEMLTAASGAPQASTTMMEKQLEIVRQHSIPISSVLHALKMQVLEQILTFAREAADKTLVFSHSIKTLDYVGEMLEKKAFNFIRIDGTVITSSRQSIVKRFNTEAMDVGLISTRAGGQGLNMFGANRVVIIDTHYNPIWEEQAIGRAYRLGQQKPVFVYRLTVGGTFEEALLNQAVFKQQLATRVVDKKNPMRYALKGAKQFLFHPRDLEQRELDSFIGKDPLVLDRVLDCYSENPVFRSIELTETFQEEDTLQLTPEEERQAQQIAEENRLRRRNPAAYNAKMVERARQREFELQQRYHNQYGQGFRSKLNSNGPSTSSKALVNNHGIQSPGNSNESPLTGETPERAPPATHQGDPFKNADPFSRNTVPVLGVNTAIREAATLSPEKSKDDIARKDRAETEPLEYAKSAAAGSPFQSTLSLRERPSTASRVETPHTPSVGTKHEADTPSVPSATPNGHSSMDLTQQGMRPPDTGNQHKRKRSKSPTPGRAKPKTSFGFPVLDNLFNRETSRNGGAHP
ncbi:MAG: hypothetical protein Q9191_005064 [Dirinaria sp. TL-2023a]